MRTLFENKGEVYCSPSLLEYLNLSFYFSTREYVFTDYLSSNENILKRRNALFSDVDRIPGCKDLLDECIFVLDHISKIVKMSGDLSDKEQCLYSVKQFENYKKVIDDLAEFEKTNRNKFTSFDLQELLQSVRNIAESDEYRQLCKGTAALLDKISHAKSVTVGFNLDAALSPHEAGILSVNDDTVKSGKLLDKILFYDTPTERKLLSMAPLLPPQTSCSELEYTALNYAIYSALNKIFGKQLASWVPEINRYMADKLSFLLELLPDLHFVSSVVDMQRKFTEAGLKLCTPQYKSAEQGSFYAVGIYNPILALKMKDGNQPVKNTFCFDEKGRIFVLTGPNSGGKTVFMQTLGIIQVMAQLGMNLPAASVMISPAKSILVHFPLYKATQDKGRLEDECAKIKEMFLHTDKDCFFLMDETFSSTDSEEATALSAEVLRAFSALFARGVYATHFHRLKEQINPFNCSANCHSPIDFLSATLSETGERTFIIKRTDADIGSHARTVFEKYGITFDLLTGKSESKTEE